MGTVFELKLLGDEPAILLLLWRRDGDDWRVVTYHVLTP
jgi:hypothetical protein